MSFYPSFITADLDQRMTYYPVIGWLGPTNQNGHLMHLAWTSPGHIFP